MTTTALTAVAPLLWGTTYWTTTEVLPPGRPLLAAALRALPVGLVLLVLVRRRPHGIWWLRAAVLGTLNIGAFFALLFVAAYRLPGGAAATLTALQPLFALAFGAWWLAAPPRPAQLAAAATGTAGVALVVGGAPSTLDPAGIAAALGAAVSMAAGIVLTKRWRPPVDALTFTAWQLVAGGLFTVPLLLALEGLPPGITVEQAAGYAYLGLVATGLAYVLWVRGIGRLPVGGVSVLALLSPLTATVVGWLALAEPTSPAQTLGVALILAGVAAGQLTPSRKDPA